MKDKRKDHETMSKPSLKQQFCKYVDGDYLCCVKNWRSIIVLPRALWQADKIVLNLEILKLYTR